jgi:hypothetical protein
MFAGCLHTLALSVSRCPVRVLLTRPVDKATRWQVERHGAERRGGGLTFDTANDGRAAFDSGKAAKPGIDRAFFCQPRATRDPPLPPPTTARL